MKVFFLHGLGGGKGDWDAIKISRSSVFGEITGDLDFFSTAKAVANSINESEEPVTLVGYSMGGRIALQASDLLMPGLLKGIVLISTGFGYSSEEDRSKRRELDEEWALLAEQNPRKFWESWYQQEIFSTFHRLEDAKKSRWLHSRYQLSAKKIANQFRLLGQGMHPDLMRILEKRKKEGLPLLYLAGEKDKKYAGLAKKLAQQGFPADLASDAGHILPLEAPDFLVEKLNDFLN